MKNVARASGAVEGKPPISGQGEDAGSLASTFHVFKRQVSSLSWIRSSTSDDWRRSPRSSPSSVWCISRQEENLSRFRSGCFTCGGC